MSDKKILIFSAPSGAGKTTIVRHLLATYPNASFSISCTTRPIRPNETDGKDYYFISADEFRKKISENAFVEFEEVYNGLFYGTLKSEIERVWNEGKHVVADVDVKGGLALKRYFKDKALAVFVRPPSKEALAERLSARNTESPESLKKRLDKAGLELSFEPQFDLTIVNDQLPQALAQACHLYEQFTS